MFGQHRQDSSIGVTHRIAEYLTEGARTPFPIEERSRLLTHDSHREYHVGDFRHGRMMILNRYDEVDTTERGNEIVRIVRGFDAAHEGRTAGTRTQ